jgi:hypothetical protein
LEAEGGFVNLRYRWENAVPNFRMPVKVTTGPGRYEFITPTTEWKTKKLRGLAPEDFKVAEDLFYLKLDLSRDSLEPQRKQSP